MSSIIMSLLFCFMGIVVGDLRVKELPLSQYVCVKVSA